VSIHRIHVHEVQQAAAGGSYVCIFDATVTLRSAGVTQTTVTGVEPANAPAEAVEQAVRWIGSSATEVFGGAKCAASVAITRLVVNEYDWKETRFKLYARREFLKILAVAQSGDDRPLSSLNRSQQDPRPCLGAKQ